MADCNENIRVGPTYTTCPQCGGCDDGYGSQIDHFEFCLFAPVGKARKAQGVLVDIDDLPDDLRRALAEPSAPAAPSVGEPEPYTDDEMATILAALPDWFVYSERSVCPKCHDEGGGFKMSCPPICTVCGWKSSVHPTAMDEALPQIVARFAALRSSLEEARKDSERLATLRASIEALPRLDMFYNYADSEITEQADGQFIDRALVLALIVP